ncbi:hypothetical protein K438DRAFT_1780332 [Mycena galopus ATCC 62051]|nr:hypothetical protein K438DRAFT_1780332 [Mycena galopus ATCC 62051]
MNSIWQGINNELGEMALRILAIIANSGTNERAFSVMGRTYSDKTRNLLDPECAHKSLLVRRDVNKTHPFLKECKRRHIIQFQELRADVARGGDNNMDDPDLDDGLDQDLSRDSAEHLTRELDKIQDDADELEAVPAPSNIQHTTGRIELFNLEKIFAVEMVDKTSPWGGSLRAHALNGESVLNAAMAEFEEDAPHEERESRCGAEIRARSQTARRAGQSPPMVMPSSPVANRSEHDCGARSALLLLNEGSGIAVRAEALACSGYARTASARVRASLLGGGASVDGGAKVARGFDERTRVLDEGAGSPLRRSQDEFLLTQKGQMFGDAVVTDFKHKALALNVSVVAIQLCLLVTDFKHNALALNVSALWQSSFVSYHHVWYNEQGCS